jgi:hypothetical protein
MIEPLRLSKAREALEESGGDWERAARQLREQAEVEIELREDLLMPLLDNAVWQAIRQAASTERQWIWRGKTQQEGEAKATTGLTLLGKANATSVYDYPLPAMGGLRLGAANYAHLDRCIGFHSVYEASHAKRRKLFQQIRERLPEDEAITVRDIWQEDDLCRIIEMLKLS